VHCTFKKQGWPSNQPLSEKGIYLDISFFSSNIPYLAGRNLVTHNPQPAMTINLHRLDDAFHLQATNADGLTVETDGGLAIGGQNAAMSPMQLVLSAVGSCSSIDIILLLKKQRQNLEDIRISVTGTRRDEEPRIFTGIHVAYTLVGDVDDKKAERACRLSMEKMCSVSLMLKAGGVEITWEYEVLNA
jgi:putative redox protein